MARGTDGAGTTTSMDEAGLYRLVTWLSPGFPVGAFSYSHGFERAVEAGLVRDEPGLVGWLEDLLAHGTLGQEAILLARAHAAVEAEDEEGFAELRALAAALPATGELLLETTAQGVAFARTCLAAWPHPDGRLARLVGEPEGPPPVAYPLAVGAAAAAHGIPPAPALLAFLQSVVANLVSAAVRLIPLGQTAGQRALAALEPAVRAAALRADRADLDELGSASLVLDWCSLSHETQYTRLFRS
jgi:urease accessory protein